MDSGSFDVNETVEGFADQQVFAKEHVLQIIKLEVSVHQQQSIQLIHTIQG